MKKYTLFREGIFYKGNLHTHTTESDGVFTPEQSVQLYKSRGYDFLAITDHNKYGIFDSFNTDDFIIIPGIEVDTVYDDNIHHIVGISTPQKTKFSHGQEFVPGWATNTSPQELIDMLNNGGNYAIYAHPFWSNTDPNELCRYKGLLGMEIINYSCEQSWKSGIGEVYFEKLLKAGKYMWCFGSDDAHGHDPDYCGGFIRVKCDKLTHDSIINAIVKGSFYSSYLQNGDDAPEIFDFYVDEGRAYARCSECRSIFFIEGRTVYFAHHAKGNPVCTAESNLPDGVKHIRLVCTDFKGNISWSQPIVL